MPYKIKGKCIYKKDSNKKVGCTTGSTKKYMAALHANVEESVNENYKLHKTIIADGAHEATVLFDLEISPGAQVGLVYDLSNAELGPDYVCGFVRDPNTKKLQKFEDPEQAAELLSPYGIEQQDIENEMFQQGIEDIEANLNNEGEAGLNFESLFNKIINS